jgi:hypothetical protein
MFEDVWKYYNDCFLKYFYLKMYQNNIFKKLFLISTHLKRFKNIKKKLNKNEIFKFYPIPI